MEKIPNPVKEVLYTLNGAGYEAWCVGGCVRDRLMGREPGDWDVTTSALPEELLHLFGERAIPTGIQHGTITIRTAAGPVEATTFRVDGNYQDHRRPDAVHFTRSLEEDLKRRDFTVNAMAMDLNGVIRDPFGGQEDLKQGVLRCVGVPDRRFEEDALRILRGLRFAATLEFQLEEKTAAALVRKRELLRSIAVERIWMEMRRLLCGNQAAEIFRAYPSVFGVFWPELLPMIGFDQRNPHHVYDVWEHTLHCMEQVPDDLLLRLTMLLHDIGKPDCCTVDCSGVGHFYGHPARSAELADQMLQRVKCDSVTRETVVRLVTWHDRNIPRTDVGIRRALRELGETDFRCLLIVKRADCLSQASAFRNIQNEIEKAESILNRLIAEHACVSLGQLAVNGRDLIELGFEGPAIGNMLHALLDKVVDGELNNDRTALLAWVRKAHQI